MTLLLKFNNKPLLYKGLRNTLVGMTGFEPTTPRTPCVCATRLRHIPKKQLNLKVKKFFKTKKYC